MTSGAIRFIGIDFSGAVRPWLPRVTNPTVWIATVEATGQHLTVRELRPAQDLPGSGDGFSKLVNWLGEGKFAAAAIDAPFSIPAIHIPDGEHAELLRRVGWMLVGKGRVFPAGDQLVALANSVSPMTSLKPLRHCEAYWRNAGSKSGRRSGMGHVVVLPSRRHVSPLSRGPRCPAGHGQAMLGPC